MNNYKIIQEDFTWIAWSSVGDRWFKLVTFFATLANIEKPKVFFSVIMNAFGLHLF